MLVRTSPESPGRLVRVSLADVSEKRRLQTTRRLREKRWRDELRPDTGYSPTMAQRLAALGDAVELERAALWPKRTHLLPEKAVNDVLSRD